MSEQASESCKTCGYSYEWHQVNKPIHPFNTGQAGATAFLGNRRARTPDRDRSDAQRGSQTPPRVMFPTDPVLRVALISSGVITTEQLEAAERQLTVAFGQQIGGSHGQPSTQAWRGEVQVGEAAPVDVGQRSRSSEEVGSQPEYPQE